MTKRIRKSFIEKEGAMKELIITTVAVFGLLMAASLTDAESSRLELYYNGCITQKIVNCKRIASDKNHTNSRMIRLVEMRTAEAQFYKEHREELVREMIRLDVGKEPYKINYFLIKQFHNSHLADSTK